MKHYLSILLCLVHFVIMSAQDGELDISFNEVGANLTPLLGGSMEDESVAIQSNGKIVVSGTYFSDSNKADFIVLRYNTDGTLDTSFGNAGISIIDFFGEGDQCFDLLVQVDDKIVLVGSSKTTGVFGNNIALVRLHTDGTFDEGFGEGGIVLTDFEEHNDTGYGIAVQSDGKLIVSSTVTHASFAREQAIWRYNTDGSLDESFGENGLVLSGKNYYIKFCLVQADDKILTGGFVLGSSTDVILMRYTANGELDASFGEEGFVRTRLANEEAFGSAAVLQRDGKIVVSAGITNDTGRDFGVIRYNEDGSLDTSFGISGRVVTDFSLSSNTNHAIAVQEDGKIVTAGFLGIRPNHDFALARYMPDGALDHTFGINGRIITDLGADDLAFTMAIQADNKILAVGRSITSTSGSYVAIARYLSGLETVGTQTLSDKKMTFQLYPNPATSNTRIYYTLDEDAYLTIELYNLIGQLQYTFIEQKHRQKGQHQELLRLPLTLNSGNYLVVLKTEDQSRSRIVIIP